MLPWRREPAAHAASVTLALRLPHLDHVVRERVAHSIQPALLIDEALQCWKHLCIASVCTVTMVLYVSTGRNPRYTPWGMLWSGAKFTVHIREHLAVSRGTASFWGWPC